MRPQKCTSVDAFIHHPLATRILDNEDRGGTTVRWMCATDVPNAGEYSFMTRPGMDDCLTSWRAVLTWIHNRRMFPHAFNYAILNMGAKELYCVDIVAERDDKLCLVLIYHATTPGRAYAECILNHAKTAKRVCEEQYALHAEVALLRLSPNGNRVTGIFV